MRGCSSVLSFFIPKDRRRWIYLPIAYDIVYTYDDLLRGRKKCRRQSWNGRSENRQGRFEASLKSPGRSFHVSLEPLSHRVFKFLLLLFFSLFTPPVHCPSERSLGRPSRSSYFPHNAPYTRQFMRRNVLNTRIHCAQCVRLKVERWSVEFLDIPSQRRRSGRRMARPRVDGERP